MWSTNDVAPFFHCYANARLHWRGATSLSACSGEESTVLWDAKSRIACWFSKVELLPTDRLAYHHWSASELCCVVFLLALVR